MAGREDAVGAMVGESGWGTGALAVRLWYGGLPFWYSTLGYGATRIRITPTPMTTVGTITACRFSRTVPEPQQNPEDGDNQFFAEARAAFYAGNYPEALRNIEHAAIDKPTNEDVHQFHALVFFALGDYQKAAAVAHTVLDRGPGWNWAWSNRSIRRRTRTRSSSANSTLHQASTGSRQRRGSCWLTSI